MLHRGYMSYRQVVRVANDNRERFVVPHRYLVIQSYGIEKPSTATSLSGNDLMRILAYTLKARSCAPVCVCSFLAAEQR